LQKKINQKLKLNNRIITEDQDKPAESKAEPSVLSETVKKVADFDFNINKDFLKNQFWFLVFLSFLIVAFIYNGHQTEKKIRKIDLLNKEIKEMRSEYISVLSYLMNESKQSSIAKKLADRGIKELKAPPQKITINGD